ncbi:MAG: response regulator [Desulfocapsaceae bacterium]|nr:response regulator [Desulfocapsaceae bacterium]
MVRNVLFVDDDQIMLLAVEKRFAAFSDYFTMIKAGDGFEAVQILKDTSISLIVLDLKMPRMDGMSLLSHTREKYPDIPVIIVSGYRTAEMYKLAKAKGVIAYISKPFQVDDLGKIIMSTLQKEADGGIMHNVSPTVFLQLMEMEAKTCTIRILNKTNGMGGILYFIDGNLLDARVGETQGLDAAYKVFGWDDVTIFIQNECTPRDNIINSQLQPIIMKAVGMKDEEEEPLKPDKEELGDVARAAAEAERKANQNPVNDLGNLDLPEEFFVDEEVGEALEGSPEVPKKMANDKPQSGAAKQQKSQLQEIEDLLYNEVGAKCGLEDIYHDNKVGNVVEYLNELGAMFNFGKLKVGYIDDGGQSDRIILPGHPSTVVVVNQKCPQDKIIQVLSQYH